MKQVTKINAATDSFFIIPGGNRNCIFLTMFEHIQSIVILQMLIGNNKNFTADERDVLCSYRIFGLSVGAAPLTLNG